MKSVAILDSPNISIHIICIPNILQIPGGEGGEGREGEFGDTDTSSHLSSVCALLQQEPNLTSLPAAQETLQRVIEIRDRDFSVVQVQHDELVHVQTLQALEKRREQEQQDKNLK